ncbi:MAG: DUF2782 domain-containing protein [Pseudomonadales bacterium]|nr:DUF2782 domain-containing protein [Pseudomonadales bacterium]MCP5183515.1 DUF2782 domain-containing protein [Pseudomonadales bacterium]
MTLLHTFLRRVPVLALGLLAVVTTLPGWAAQAGDDGPDVTIIAGEKRTIYEYWQNGHLRMVRVVPAIGKPYYLVPRDNTRGYGELERADMLLPSWVIVEF